MSALECVSDFFRKLGRWADLSPRKKGPLELKGTFDYGSRDSDLTIGAERCSFGCGGGARQQRTSIPLQQRLFPI